MFKVSYEDPAEGPSDVVVRISLGNDAHERAQAEREAVVLEKVRGVAGPLLHDFRRDSPWFDAPVMCMQFVPGEERDFAGMGSADLERLGAVVGWLHGLPTDDLVEWSPEVAASDYRAARLAQVAASMPSVRDPLPASVQRRLAPALQAVQESREQSFPADERLVLLHGDIAVGNILWGAEPVLIDWEYARIGDPADEIAYTFSQNGLTTPQRDAFWRGYAEQRVGLELDHVIERVDWWEPVTLLGSALWWIERWSSGPKAPGYYLDHALRRLDRFDEACRRLGP